MSPILFQFLIEQTVWIPIAFCLVRFKEIKPVYIPLFFYLLAKEAAEIASLVMIKGMHINNNAPPYNLLYLLEALLITWLLFNIRAFKGNKKLFIMLQLFWIFLWIADIFFIGSFQVFNHVFRITYTFTLTIVMTALISRLAVSVRLRLQRNTNFCLCIAFAFWFLYNMLYEFTDYMSKYNGTLELFGNRITSIISYAEILLYLLITWAIYCIPVKRTSFV